MKTMNGIFQTIKTGWVPGIFILVFHACDDRDGKAKVTEPAPIPVKVAKVAVAGEGYFSAGSGPIKAVNSTTISTRIMGLVERIPVKVGQKVRKGQILISLRNTDLQAKKAQAEASIIAAKAGFANAEKDYRRYVNLYNQNSASQKELDDMTVRYETAKAGYEAAKEMANEVDAQFAYANIRAPFNGVVTNTHIDEGALAHPGMPLVSLEAPGNFEVEAKVPETNITGLQPGTQAKVFIKVLNTTVKGELTELSTSAQFSGGQYLATVELQEVPGELLSGMFASVFFPDDTEETTGAAFVPRSALIEKGQLTGVYTIGPEDTAILRWLRLGKPRGGEVEVLSGLAVDEEYILSAEGKLFNGAKVAIQ